MAKIIDPDDLVRSTTLGQLGTDGNIWIETSTKLIALLAFGSLEDNSFVEGGVTLQAFYSYLKEEWKTDNDLIKYPFPMIAITPEQFEFIDEWEPSGASTVNLFRDGGFAITSAGTTWDEYIGVITLGSLTLPTQVYFQQQASAPGDEPVDFVLTGAVNQCVKIYSDPTRDNYNYRDYFKTFAREQAQLYGDASHTDIGVTTFTYQAYRFPLTNQDDLKVTVVDTGITWSGDVSVTYYTEGQARIIGGVSYDFDIIIEGSDESTENIYMEIQRELRQIEDHDEGAGTVTGKTADSLLSFVGDTLVTATGVYIDNFQVADTNSIDFYETGGTVVRFPFVAAGSINFNDNLQNDLASVYRMFYTNNDAGDDDGSDFGTSSAILVRSNDGEEDITDISYSGPTEGNLIVSTVTDLSIFSENNMIEVSGSASNAGFYTVTASSINQLSIQEDLISEPLGTECDLYEIIGGNVSANTSASFSYDYDNNVQRGDASSGQTAPVTLVAIGLNSAQYVKTTGNITRTNANSITLVAALERNYSNP